MYIVEKIKRKELFCNFKRIKAIPVTAGDQLFFNYSFHLFSETNFVLKIHQGTLNLFSCFKGTVQIVFLRKCVLSVQSTVLKMPTFLIHKNLLIQV